jgi:NADH-quinone oxidoreductase subunit N
MNELSFTAEPTLSKQMGVLLPYLIVAGGGLLVMLVDSFFKTLRSGSLYLVSVLVLLAAVVSQFFAEAVNTTLLGGMLCHQPYTCFFNYLFLGIALLTVTFAASPFGREGNCRGDFYPLLLFSVLGMMVLAAANDLLALYLGLETMSLAVYVLVGGRKGSARSSEAGFKYLLLGGFASAFLLFGMALVFGFAGTTSLTGIQEALRASSGESLLLALGGGLMLVGFGFKIAMVPFHMWTPDVYDGAPSHVTGFMATGIKAAAFAALIRFTLVLLPALSAIWFPLLAVLAVLTMTAGNLIALAQSNIKRMLAYSSIAHAGYLLLGVLALFAANGEGAARTGEVISAAGGGMLFYLVAYTLMNLAAFGIVNFLGPAPGDEADNIGGYAGLARRQPLVAAALAISLFSLAGIPATVGFMGKFYIFDAVVLMYMTPGDERAYNGRSWESALAVSVLAILTLVLGVVPGGLHQFAETAFRIMAF